ncbi:ferrous iron transport protein A [Clostridium sp. MSJ-4]|uniref:Ferrous iron transport protein A n=1 Tax=Clostridium simiarum TaxID=2841506 RepID=A0ABS6EWA7_9CLOT|nr:MULTISPECIES: ferrous iron transport protein A [Clostridium]MBU5590509.1 ferrous iron transport protein A [Clostridium simiarum]
MCVCDLKIGQRGTVLSINGDEKLAKRLLALGCVEGTEILIKRSAPLGDPIVINFRGFDMAIRKTDARNIYIDSAS